MNTRKARPPARRQSRAGRGALFLIATFLGTSGLLRVGTGAGDAFALSVAPEQTEPVTPETCQPDGGALAMLADLKEREARLENREALIADRAQALTLAKAEVDEHIAALVAAEEQLAQTLTLAEAAADDDVARLVAVYEKMKPKEAAALFGEMDPEFAAGFLARMRPEPAAQVLAGLEPKTAYTISVLLAGRNASAPRE
ncbi:hypothetical protein DEA8626_02495 [Defluviimonas aquaemixtae]|uniref:Uncharacterized protein n=1 Tax=Albidovulum aquaemixtae TaxID=1542388 RepID=A0A2R8BJE9_9RHOB|nr:hypothetical protein [Defluviimonas aquaemixtae]SPH23432.1 hypothetical protein DEA8626_02495 [Defluviimonas aquaemixtae]